MRGDPSTQNEFEQHLISDPACVATLDLGSGDIVPVALCSEGQALQYAAAWDADAAHLKHMKEDRI